MKLKGIFLIIFLFSLLSFCLGSYDDYLKTVTYVESQSPCNSVKGATEFGKDMVYIKTVIYTCPEMKGYEDALKKIQYHEYIHYWDVVIMGNKDKTIEQYENTAILYTDMLLWKEKK